MNSEDFVEALKRYVMDSAIEGTIAILKKPPGRRISPQERIRSEWYNALSPEDAMHVNSALATAAHTTLFGFLVALDGDRKIDDEGGRYELVYVTDRRVVLNDPQAIGLHDLLNNSD